MPSRAKRPCGHPGCRVLIPVGAGGVCDEHRKHVQRADDQRRGTSTERGYDARWRKARKMFLARNPVCVRCHELNRVEIATVVDHVDPHRGDYEKFWDESNWQALCKPCHDKKTATEDGAFGNKVKQV